MQENSSSNTNNTVSTGGEGYSFEHRVQAYFLIQMMLGGFLPKMGEYKIECMTFQSQDFKTDDCVIFLKDYRNYKRKILTQIKIGKSATISSKDFSKAVKDAWLDFCDPKFCKDLDKIFLITGEFNQSDNNIFYILNHIHSGYSSVSFWNNYNNTNSYNKKAREKFKKIIEYISSANRTKPSDEELYEFFRIFYIIKSDLHDNSLSEGGINLSLIQTNLTKIFNGKKLRESPQRIWDGLISFVADHNNAGIITADHEKLIELFLYDIVEQQRDIHIIDRTDLESDGMEVKNIKTNYKKEFALLSLVGSFDENNPEDVKIIERVISESFEVIQPELQNVLSNKNNIKYLNGIWKVDSKRKVILPEFADYIFDNDLDNFSKVFIEVVGEIDPALDLPAKQRYMSSILGKKHKFSNTLRMGLANGMAMLVNNTELFTRCSSDKISKIAYFSIQKLLKDNYNPKIWASLRDVMIPIAEVNPTKFLDTLEITIKLKENPFIELVKDSSSDILKSIDYLASIRSALTNLSWDKILCAQSCLILAKLAILEDLRENKQEDSISAIISTILPWRPQTTASLEVSHRIVENILKNNTDVGWKVLSKLLPGITTSQVQRPLPKWHKLDEQDLDRTIYKDELYRQYDYYSNLYVISIEKISQFLEAIENMHHLTDDAINNLLDKLISNSEMNYIEEDKMLIWHKLLETINHHEQYSDSDWALSTEIIDKLKDIASQFEPTDNFKKYARLFNHPDYELFRYKGIRKGRQRLLDQREKAIKVLLDKGGIDIIIKFVEYVTYPDQVGFSLGKISDKYDYIILPNYLDDGNKKHKDFAKLFIEGRFYQLNKFDRWNWIKSINYSDWSAKQILEFSFSLPFSKGTWTLIQQCSESIENEYWMQVSNIWQSYHEDYSNYVVDKLLIAKRPILTLQYISNSLCFYKNKNIDPKDKINLEQTRYALLSSTQEQRNDNDIDLSNIIYEINEVIKFVQANTTYPDEELFRIEWYYLSFFGQGDIQPKSIIYSLSNSPEDFSKMISIYYKSDKKSIENTQHSEQVQRNLFTILTMNEFKIMPGTDDNNEFNVEVFKSWIKEVKKICKESGHLEAAKSVIGGYLINAPTDPTGLYLHKSVAEELNKEDNERMRVGYEIGIQNRHGTGIVDRTGKDKFDLQSVWNKRADQMQEAGFFKFASSLKSLSEHFKNEVTRVKDREKRFSFDLDD